MSLRRACLPFALAAGILIVSAPAAGAATFSNPGAITIPNTLDNASPYPSSIAVSGLTGAVTDVNVSLLDFSHTNPDDVAFVLVAPGGQAFKPLDGAGGNAGAVNVNLTLNDSAAALVPTANVALTSGTFRPTSQYDNAFALPAPGPGTAYSVPAPSGTATLASAFNGAAPNGTWNLFVRDFRNGDSGQVTGGWRLEVTTPPTPQPATPTRAAKKCKKKKKKKKRSASILSAATNIAAGSKRCKKKKKKRK